MVGRHQRMLLVGVVGVAAVVLVAHPVQLGTPRDRPAPRGPGDVKIVTVDPESGATLWPYTSKRRRFDTLTLPMNVVVRGNVWRVRSVLVTGADAQWNSSAGEWQGVGDEAGTIPESDRRWYETHGATRYTYVRTSASGGHWEDAAYQLHDGKYFGTRYHLRAYAGGEGETSWTAIQAHYEHWDWFRLRHTVGSTALGRQSVERAFYGRRDVAAVRRARFANGGIADADGWASVVDLRPPSYALPSRSDAGVALASLGALLVGSLSGRDPWPTVRAWVDDADPRLWAVAAVAVGLLPGVRWAAIAVEGALPGLSPKVVAATGYLTLAVGLPACAYLAGETSSTTAAVLAATGGVTIGLLADYVLLGVAVVPLSVVVHRTALVAVLGVVAASGSPRVGERVGDHGRLVAVGALWVGVLAWPLLDVL